MDANIMAKNTPEIQVFAMFPSNLERTEWNWLHCLTFPINTLDELQLSQKPYKWIRYVTGIVVGAEGDLSFSRDSSHDILDYDDNLGSGSVDLYYHISDAEKQRLFPIDPDIGHTHVTSSEHRNPGADFHKSIAVRDKNKCVLSGFEGSFLHAAHLLPHSKGDQYIYNYTQHRSRDASQNDIVSEIDDVRNAILLNSNSHHCFGKIIAFLMTPNFALTTRDIDPTAEPTEKRCTVHLFDPNKPACLGDHTLCSGSIVRMPDPEKMNQWPPNILFDAVYASIVLDRFGARGIHDALELWKPIYYPSGITSPTQASYRAIIDDRDTARKRKGEQDDACGCRAEKRAKASGADDDDRFDNFDLLTLMPYLFIPPDEQRAAWRREAEEKAERARRNLEDLVGGWAEDVAKHASDIDGPEEL